MDLLTSDRSSFFMAQREERRVKKKVVKFLMHGECVAAAVLHLHVDMTNLFYVSPLATFEVERSQRDEP